MDIMDKITGYDLSRNWFNFCFENPEKIKPNHTAIYFFAIEHCNRLGWKEKFGLPTTMVMEAVGIKSYNTYINTLRDLVEFGFIKMIEKSKNQYSSNIIALSNFNKALDKALDKALIKHTSKQSESTGESIDSIIKQITNKQLTNEQVTRLKKSCDIFLTPKEEEVKNEFLPEREVLRNVYTYFDFKIIDSLTEKNKINWLETINKLHRLDGYSFAEIQKTIIWGREDEFWNKNFLSISGLRNKKNDTTKFFKINKQMLNNGTERKIEETREVVTGFIDRIANDPNLK